MEFNLFFVSVIIGTEGQRDKLWIRCNFRWRNKTLKKLYVILAKAGILM